jgi:signal recognition particle subunit SRP54
MFDSLSGKLQNAFRNLRGLGKISEANVADSLREVRMALLEADVNFKVARDFIERVKTKAIGSEVVQSVQPGQQIIKIIHDELVDLLGATNAALKLDANPTSILMVGLHGSSRNKDASRCSSPRMCIVRRPWTSWKRWASSLNCRFSSSAAKPMS